jgi:2-(1,2-epoxy-1,2-dihydrophenyl)acetyl-CoA isomerase
MSDNPKLLVTLENGIKRITFNRPEKKNPVDHETFELFRQAFADCSGDGTRVVILSGAGDAFSSGADLSSFGKTNPAEYDVTKSLREVTNPAILAMRELPIPIIARVHGVAAGIGCNYALAADIIIASDKASFGELFIRIGLMPDGGGTFFLPRLTGYHKAFELMALGEVISAEEAFQLGMVNRVVPVQQLDATVDQLAERLLQMAPISLAKIKAALNHSAHTDLAGALEFEAVNQAACFHSQDFIEGVTAFLQKRKPVFKGK